jgi:hypothetical protein
MRESLVSISWSHRGATVAVADASATLDDVDRLARIVAAGFYDDPVLSKSWDDAIASIG